MEDKKATFYSHNLCSSIINNDFIQNINSIDLEWSAEMTKWLQALSPHNLELGF